MKNDKNGNKARIGLFVALAAWIGKDYADRYFQRRKDHGHPRGGYTSGHPGAFGGVKRAGIRLVRRLSRRAKTVRQGWPVNMDSRQLRNLRRKMRRKLFAKVAE